jgi:hypothetical protein
MWGTYEQQGGRLRHAESLLREAYLLLQETPSGSWERGHEVRMHNLVGTLADIMWQKKRLEEAVFYLRWCFEPGRTCLFPVRLSSEMARSLCEKGDLVEAESFALKALYHLEHGSTAIEEAESTTVYGSRLAYVNTLLANIRAKQGRHDDAFEHDNRATELIVKASTGICTYIFDSVRCVAEWHIARGNFKKAVELVGHPFFWLTYHQHCDGCRTIPHATDFMYLVNAMRVHAVALRHLG